MENFPETMRHGVAARRAPGEPILWSQSEISGRRLAESLAGSPFFREFQQVFEAATGLPLTLRPIESWRLAHAGNRNQNGFCVLLSQKSRSCAACLQVQQRVCEGADCSPCTLSCAFGLRETAVAVKIGRETVAYLQTGQVFFEPPTPAQTRQALRQMSEWGLDLDRNEAVRRYEATAVVRKVDYEARVKLLQFFAQQLGSLANQILLVQEHAEPAQITRAREFIQAQYQEKLTLSGVAGQVNISASHFCKGFKKAVGLNFTEYVCRVRVEKAKNLLLNLNYRVSEIAFEVGFQSVSHFNRAFRTIAGDSPTNYRRQLVTAVTRGRTAARGRPG